MAGSYITSLCCFCIVSIRISLGFNLDYEYPVIKQGPADSFFGFSVAEHQFSDAGSSDLQKRFLVGAPNGDNKFQKSLKKPGTVYTCDPMSGNLTCEDQVPFDNLGNSGRTEDKNNQWFGVSLKSAGTNKPVMSCAHKYLYKTTAGNYHLYEGACHTVTSRLRSEESYTPCRQENDDLAKSPTAPSYKNSGQCLSGIGLDIVEAGGQRDYLIGSVGYALQQGAIYRMAEKQDENTPDTLVTKVDKNDQGMIGFSVDHGNFLNKNRIDIVSGAPRANSIGMVVIFSKEKAVNESLVSLRVKLTLPNPEEKVQIASSYGFAVKAIDADKDNVTELLVGAPYHAGEGFPGQGMVYYYKQNDKGKLTLKHKLTVKGNRLNFGSAIVRVDLDLDGYEDAVIGAPFEEDGRGAVYVYRGSAKGLYDKPSQRVAASMVSPSLSGFGRSLATGMDMDSNGYNDVLVGAYTSQSVVLLRSRGVIKIDSYFDILPTFPYIRTDIKRGAFYRFRFRYCHRYVDASGRITAPQRARLSVEIEPGRMSRLVWTRNDRSLISMDRFVKTTWTCLMMNTMLNHADYHKIPVYPDVTIHAYWEPSKEFQFRKPQKVPGKVVSLDSYTFFSNEDKDTFKKAFTFHFKRDCGPCIPDLAITAKGNRTLSLGTDSYTMNVSLVNNGNDTAFEVGLWVYLTEGISLTDVLAGERRVLCEDAEVLSDKSTLTKCNSVFDQMKSRDAAVVMLTFDTKKLSPMNQDIKITVNASSANAEVGTYDDNIVTVPITIRASADLALSSSFRTRQEFYGGEIKGESVMKYDTDIGLVVTHRYVILNYGPDLLPSAVFTVHWPFEAVSGKHLLYLTNVDAENAVCKIKDGIVNMRGYRLSISNATKLVLNPNVNLKRVRKAAETSEDPKTPSETEPENIKEPAKKAESGSPGNLGEQPGAIGDGSKSPNKGARGDKGGMEGQILDCRKGTAHCVSFTCEAKNLANGDNAYISLTSRIWNATFLMDYKGKVVTVVSYASVKVGSNVSYIKDEDPNNNKAELFTVIRPDFPTKRAEKIAVWKIALAVLAGVILLALLIFGLYKVGFFNRRSSSQMRKKKEVDGADDTLLGGARK